MRADAKKIRTVAELAVLLTAALLLSYLESLIDLSLPGVKIGVSNVAVTFVLYRFGGFAAVGFGFSKTLLAALFTGRVSALPYALPGMAAALAAMLLLKKTRAFSPLGVNVGGAAAHVAGQLAASVLLLSRDVLRFCPWLICAACISGFLTYLPLRALLQRLPPKQA